jgi:serine/threonine-protein kinase
VKACAQCQVQYPDAVEYCPRDGTRLPPSPALVVEEPEARDPLLGTTIDGRYVVESILGQGGMGTVYAGRHAIIDKRVAIKVLRADHVENDPTAAQRFLVEAKAASKIGHQNIVDITDFGVLKDGQAYFVMEFLDGPTLGKLVHEAGFLSPLRAIAITVQIARGLQAAHDKGIIHRDLKPENIFVLPRDDRDGESELIKIVDFGIAKDQKNNRRLTMAGMVLGTPEYMSPEQATGQPTDHRVDMYALGCILYEMLTGDVPFKGETPTKTLTQHVFDAPEPPSKRRPDLAIPAALEAIVLRTLQKKADERFADMRALMSALERVESELKPAAAASATSPSAPSSPSSSPRIVAPAASQAPTVISPAATDSTLLAAVKPRRPGLLVAAGALGGVLVVGGTIALVRGPSHKPTSPAAAVAAQPTTTTPSASPSPSTTPTAVAPADRAAEVELVLRTTPPGADVLRGAERLGATPLTLRWPRSDEAVALTFRHAGYRDAAREIVPSADKELEIVLERRASAAPSAPRVAHSRPTPATPEAPGSVKQKQRVSDLRNPFD